MEREAKKHEIYEAMAYGYSARGGDLTKWLDEEPQKVMVNDLYF